MRDRLLEQRAEQLKQAAEPIEPRSMDMADSASDDIEHDLALAEVSATQEALNEIESALRRIQNGTYGVCEMTGKPIAAERLKAVPWTRFTAEAVAQLERQGWARPHHLGILSSVREVTTGNLEESASEDEIEVPAPEDESLHPISASEEQENASDETGPTNQRQRRSPSKDE